MNMKAQHTPGPWIAKAYDRSRFLIMGDNETIATVRTNLGSPVTQDKAGQGEANARLIATAPELLVALKAIATRAEAIARNYDDNELRTLIAELGDNAGAAIAKARGEG